MTVVHFPKPKSKRDPNRPAGSLLLAQVKHLREAEKSLPPDYHSGIFSHAIETEGEAARFVKAVTEAIHKAHDEQAHDKAAAARVRKPTRRKHGLEIAAMADESAGRGKRPRSKAKKSGRKK